jgi:hypothetical protein
MSDLQSQSNLKNPEAHRSIEVLQDHLWRAWCVYKKISVKNPLAPNDLSSEARGLLEAAIIGEEVLLLDLAIQFQGGGPTDNSDLRSWKEEKLFWLCQVFIDSDGTIATETSKVKFRNRFRLFCQELQIDADSLEEKFLKVANELPFFPVYDWVFKRELETGKVKESVASPGRHTQEQAGSLSDEVTDNERPPVSRSSQVFPAINHYVKIFAFLIGLIFLGGVLRVGVKHYFREDKIADPDKKPSNMTPDERKYHETEQTERRLERIRKLREGRE